MRNSKTLEEELVIGRILLTAHSIFPQSSSSGNQTIFDVEAAAQMIGHIDIIFCYRLSKTPLKPVVAVGGRGLSPWAQGGRGLFLPARAQAEQSFYFSPSAIPCYALGGFGAVAVADDLAAA
jgi:hypothetical protein